MWIIWNAKLTNTQIFRTKLNSASFNWIYASTNSISVRTNLTEEHNNWISARAKLNLKKLMSVLVLLNRTLIELVGALDKIS